jgi:glycosyltransferase involved in cell wall biosynthesis
VKSVLRQTYPDWEMILIDDGSAPPCAALCDRLAERDRRIRVFHQENKGAERTRQYGVALALGEEMTFLDSDDVLEPEALRRAKEAMEQYGADLVQFEVRRFLGPIRGPRKKTDPPVQVAFHDEILRKLILSYYGIAGFPGYMCGKLYTAALIRRVLDFAVVVQFFGEDLSNNLRLLPHVRCLVMLREPLYSYRMGGGTSRFMKHFFDDSLALHALLTETLEREPLIPREAAYYAAVQLKNELYYHLCGCREKGGYSMEALREELLRYGTLPQVQDAVNYPRADQSGRAGFREAVAGQRWEDALALVLDPPKEPLVKRLARWAAKKLG